MPVPCSVDIRVKVFSGKAVVHRGAGSAQLVNPGIVVDGELLEAQAFIHMLSPGVLQVRIQLNPLIAQAVEQSGEEQTQNYLAVALILLGGIADLDANLADSRIDLPVYQDLHQVLLRESAVQ